MSSVSVNVIAPFWVCAVWRFHNEIESSGYFLSFISYCVRDQHSLLSQRRVASQHVSLSCRCFCKHILRYLIGRHHNVLPSDKFTECNWFSNSDHDIALYFIIVVFSIIYDNFETVAYPGIFFLGGVFNKFSWGPRAEKMGVWGR
jgi:hypothetical protein